MTFSKALKKGVTDIDDVPWDQLSDEELEIAEVAAAMVVHKRFMENPAGLTHLTPAELDLFFEAMNIISRN